MIEAEKTAEMLTTIFLGGGTSLGVSLPSRFPGEERVLSIIPSPPPSFADIGLKKPLIALLLLWRMRGGGGRGAARM